MTAINDRIPRIPYRKTLEPYRQSKISLLKHTLCTLGCECLEKAVAAGCPQFSRANYRWRLLQLPAMMQTYEIEGHHRLLKRIFPFKP